MDPASLSIVALMTLGVLIAVALPVWAAVLLAWRKGLPRRRLFVLACTLLAHGFLTFTGAALLPLEIAATWVAPELHSAGHRSVASAIFVACEQGVPIACFVVGVLASFVVPFKLSRSWPFIASAIGANNSFKPKPLRGSA